MGGNVQNLCINVSDQGAQEVEVEVLRRGQGEESILTVKKKMSREKGGNTEMHVVVLFCIFPTFIISEVPIREQLVLLCR